MYIHLVTGDANFLMDKTSFIVGGFSQPCVARALLDQGTETGFCQRFLWLFPRPSYAKFHTLEQADPEFTDKIGKITLTELILFSA